MFRRDLISRFFLNPRNPRKLIPAKFNPLKVDIVKVIFALNLENRGMQHFLLILERVDPRLYLLLLCSFWVKNVALVLFVGKCFYILPIFLLLSCSRQRCVLYLQIFHMFYIRSLFLVHEASTAFVFRVLCKTIKRVFCNGAYRHVL